MLDRRGSVHERRVVTAFPALLGRAYDCALILDDPYVSPHHARIVRSDDGSLAVEDQQSRNGTFAGESVLGSAPWRVVDDGVLRLGQTRLRFRSPEHVVAPALELAQPNAAATGGRMRLLVVTAVLVALMHALREAVADSPEPLQTAELVTTLFVVFGLLVIWGGTWALLTRLVQPRFAFAEHLGIAAAALVGFDMLASVVETVAFAWAAALFPEILSWVLFFFAFAATLFAHLRVSWVAERRRVLRTALVLTTMFFVAASVPYWSSERVRESWQVEHMFQLAPGWLRMQEPIPVDAFVDGFEDMRVRLEADVSQTKATPTPASPADSGV